VNQTKPPKPFHIHPLCELAPRMTDAEYQGLKDSINRAGMKIIEPVILFEGKILDGRHRQQAAIELGILFKSREFDPKLDGATPATYVYSKLIHRNLTESQRAAIAVEIEDQFAKDAVERQKATRYGAKKDDGGGRDATAAAGKARDAAGALFGISGRLVQDAKYVRQHNADLFAQVKSGVVKIGEAKARVARTLKDKTLKAKAKQSNVTASAAPEWEVRHCECLEGLVSIKQKSVRLIFEDGPYNIGVDYGNGKKADQLTPIAFMKFADERFAAEAELLTGDGVLAVMIGDEFADEYRVALKGTPGLYPRAWVKWYETFGNNCKDNFNRTSRHILFFSREKDGPFILHREAFNRPSDRQTKYNDKRACPGGKIWDDVWQVPRLNDNAAERVRVDKDGPTQIPLDIVRPIVLGFTDPGDLVIDPFCGTGTTAVAAITTGRRCITFERIKSTVTLATTRIKAAIADMAAALPAGRAS
jgi:DNA modification methylase